MVRLFYVIGIGVGASVFGVVGSCVDQWHRGDPELRGSGIVSTSGIP